MGAVDAVEWACVLCGRHIQNAWMSRAMNFALSLNISLWKLFRWFRRLQLLATGDWQLHHNMCPLMHHISCVFLVKHQITQVTQPPYSPELVPFDFSLFPKLNSPLKGKRFQTVDEVQKNIIGQLMAFGRTVWGPRCLLWRGLRHRCMTQYFLDRPRICAGS